jgi:hypothetical protein
MRRGAHPSRRLERPPRPDYGLRSQNRTAVPSGARIRMHRLVPYQAVVGARETESDTVSLRLRTGLSLDPIPTQESSRPPHRRYSPPQPGALKAIRPSDLAGEHQHRRSGSSLSLSLEQAIGQSCLKPTTR